MSGFLGTLLACAALTVVVGLPIAFAVRRTGEGWLLLFCDALCWGVAYSAVAVALYAWLRGPGIVADAAILAFFVVLAVIARPGLPAFRRPDRGDRWVIGLGAFVFAVAVALRLHLVNFILWLGDMGAYANWANEFVATGRLVASWPPLFSSYLSIATFIGGPEQTGANVPLLGIALIAALCALLIRLRVNRWAVLALVALVAVQIHAIWFSSFTVSEALAAPLTVMWIGAMVGVLRSSRGRLPAWLLVGGMLSLASGLDRGTGPLLLVPVFIVGISVAFTGRRGDVVRLWSLLTVATAGAAIGYWYGISRIHSYYVEAQLQGILPAGLFRSYQAAGLDVPGPRVALVLVGAVVAVAAVGAALAALTRLLRMPPLQRRRSWSAGALLVLLGGLGILGHALIRVNGLIVIAYRIGAVLWIAVGVIVVVAAVSRYARLARPASAALMTALLTGVLFLVVANRQVFDAFGHMFYLYWDRYTFSEVVPALFVLLGIGAGILVSGLRRRARRAEPSASGGVLHRAVRRPTVVGAGVIVVVIALVVAPNARETVLVRQHSLLAGSWRFENVLAQDYRDSGADEAIWVRSDATAIPQWAFPNTWWALGNPLAASFRVPLRVPGPITTDFAPDTTPTPELLGKAMDCSDANRIVVFEVEAGGDQLGTAMGSSGYDIRLVGRHTTTVPILGLVRDEHWKMPRLTVTTWLVTPDTTPQKSRCSLQNLLDG